MLNVIFSPQKRLRQIEIPLKLKEKWIPKKFCRWLRNGGPSVEWSNFALFYDFFHAISHFFSKLG